MSTMKQNRCQGPSSGRMECRWQLLCGFHHILLGSNMVRWSTMLSNQCRHNEFLRSPTEGQLTSI
jgi:hypothetical protein